MRRLSVLSILIVLLSVPVNAVEGVLPGKFSVSPSHQVQFSQGNLQYNAVQGKHICADKSTKPGTWRFADSQFECIGEANTNASKTYDGWIDLFGWCATGYSDVQPWMYVQKLLQDVKESPDLAMGDFGVYNAISNGGNEPRLWRMLTAEEWEYLLEKRSGARYLQWVTKVNGVMGLLVFPDANDRDDLIRLRRGASDENYDLLKEYTLDQWDLLEARGVVFLPLAGLMRMRDGAYQVRSFITCYAATPWDNSCSKAFMAGATFSDNDWRADVVAYDNIHSHCAVRLVVDVK